MYAQNKRENLHKKSLTLCTGERRGKTARKGPPGVLCEGEEMGVNHLVAGDSAMEENISRSHATDVREEKGWWRNICGSKETERKNVMLDV